MYGFRTGVAGSSLVGGQRFRDVREVVSSSPEGDRSFGSAKELAGPSPFGGQARGLHLELKWRLLWGDVKDKFIS